MRFNLRALLSADNSSGLPEKPVLSWIVVPVCASHKCYFAERIGTVYTAQADVPVSFLVVRMQPIAAMALSYLARFYLSKSRGALRISQKKVQLPKEPLQIDP